ncbi:MAG: hypothetical protein KJ072_26135 [Verrucomicrobia bacterium]|nr:hypothetical protein [Verrucomicrobiota bacterium]
MNIPRRPFDPEKIWDEDWRQTTLAAAIQFVRERVTPEKFQVFHLYAVQVQWIE